MNNSSSVPFRWLLIFLCVAIGVAAQAEPPVPAQSNGGPSIDKALLRAAATGRLLEIKALLQQGADPDIKARDRNARSALILATVGGYAATVEALLVGGADVNAKDKAGLGALSWAILRQRNQVAQLLLHYGAAVNSVDNSGVSPLLYAVGTQNIGLLVPLLEQGADIHAQSNENKMMPLLLAVENNNTEIATLLLRKGADVNGVNRDGYSALMAACESGSTGLVELLVAWGADSSIGKLTSQSRRNSTSSIKQPPCSILQADLPQDRSHAER